MDPKFEKFAYPSGLVVIESKEKIPPQQFSSHSGYRARPFLSLDGSRRSVWLELRVGATPTRSVRVWYSSDDVTVSAAEQQRQLYLWAAVARYLNSGGDPEQFVELFTRSAPALSKTELTEGFHLLTTYQEVEETQHIFFRSSGEAIIFVEDGYVEHTTLFELAEQVKTMRAELTDGEPGEDVV